MFYPRKLVFRALTVAGLLIAITPAGCDPSPPPREPAVDALPAEYRSCAWCCPPWRCGFNSPEYFGSSLGYLYANGQENDDNISIVSVSDPEGQDGYELAIEGSELVMNGHGQPVTGDMVVGFIIELDMDGAPLKLEITAKGLAETRNGAPRHTYALAFEDEGEQQNLCSLFKGEPNEPVATFVTGERYDFDNTIVPLEEGGFSIACAGSAVAKMLLMNYGPDDELAGLGPAEPDQREATLRMLTADYCGTGSTYTYQGAPVMFQNALGSITFEDLIGPGEVSEVEAVWSNQGALCLSHPRYALLDEISLECELPLCEGDESGEWTTRVAVKL